MCQRTIHFVQQKKVRGKNVGICFFFSQKQISQVCAKKNALPINCPQDNEKEKYFSCNVKAKLHVTTLCFTGNHLHQDNSQIILSSLIYHIRVADLSSVRLTTT